MNLRNVVLLELLFASVIPFTTAAVCFAQDAAGPSSDRIELFDRTNFRGSPTRFDSAQANISTNARSASIGQGIWQICDGTGFTGQCVTFPRNVPNLGSFRINRMIRSVRPVGSGAITSSNPADWFIVLYEEPNFRGNQMTFNRTETNINKWTCSAILGGGVWEVCDGRDFTGRCATLSSNTPGIRRHDLEFRIRSLRPVVGQTH